MKSKLLTYTQYKQSLPALFIATLASTQFPKLSFFAHSAYNVYSSFKHYKSLEKDIAVKLYGEDQTRVVKCIPQDHDILFPMVSLLLDYTLLNFVSNLLSNNSKLTQDYNSKIEALKTNYDAKIDAVGKELPQNHSFLSLFDAFIDADSKPDYQQVFKPSSHSYDSGESSDILGLSFLALNLKNLFLSPSEGKFQFIDIKTGTKISYDEMEDAEFIGYYNDDVVSGVNVADLANEADEGCVLNIQEPFITILSS